MIRVRPLARSDAAIAGGGAHTRKLPIAVLALVAGLAGVDASSKPANAQTAPFPALSSGTFRDAETKDLALEVVALRGWSGFMKSFSDNLLRRIEERLRGVNAPENRAAVEGFVREVMAPMSDPLVRALETEIALEYAGKAPIDQLRSMAAFLRTPEGRTFHEMYGTRIGHGEFKDLAAFIESERGRLTQALGPEGYRRFEAFFWSHAGETMNLDLAKIDAGLWQGIGWILMAMQMNAVKANEPELRRRGLVPLDIRQ